MIFFLFILLVPNIENANTVYQKIFLWRKIILFFVSMANKFVLVKYKHYIMNYMAIIVLILNTLQKLKIYQRLL